MGGNSFYANAEAYAFEILQQKLIKEAQRSAQQTMMELSALKSFLGQGQLIYCIPFAGGGGGGGGIPLPCSPIPFPFFPANGFTSPELHINSPLHPPLPCPPHPYGPVPIPSPPAPGINPDSGPPQQLHNRHLGQSVVHVNVKNAQSKMASKQPGLDECNLGKDGIEVTIDLREYLPAEIFLDVDEKVLEMRANHVDARGSKTFSRRYDLPACIVLDTIRCILTHDGFLMFSAAWCKME